MDTALPGHPYVKSAIDIACWDILGKATGLPVCDLLGGRRREDVTIQSSIPSDDSPEMLRTIERYHARGYRIHSAKVGSDVAADIERIEYLAERMPAGSSLTIDANRAWIPDQAIRVMQATENGRRLLRATLRNLRGVPPSPPLHPPTDPPRRDHLHIRGPGTGPP